jgi:hypothetical protein
MHTASQRDCQTPVEWDIAEPEMQGRRLSSAGEPYAPGQVGSQDTPLPKAESDRWGIDTILIKP